MENRKKEITVEELADLVRMQEGEFIILVERGKEEADGEGQAVPA